MERAKGSAVRKVTVWFCRTLKTLIWCLAVVMTLIGIVGIRYGGLTLIIVSLTVALIWHYWLTLLSTLIGGLQCDRRILRHEAGLGVF